MHTALDLHNNTIKEPYEMLAGILISVCVCVCVCVLVELMVTVVCVYVEESNFR